MLVAGRERKKPLVTVLGDRQAELQRMLAAVLPKNTGTASPGKQTPAASSLWRSQCSPAGHRGEKKSALEGAEICGLSFVFISLLPPLPCESLRIHLSTLDALIHHDSKGRAQKRSRR